MNSAGERSVAVIWHFAGRQLTEMGLGKLVHFQKRERPADGGKQDRSRDAEILIFTGIRYERDTPTMPTKPTASSSGSKRKRG